MLLLCTLHAVEVSLTLTFKLEKLLAHSLITNVLCTERFEQGLSGCMFVCHTQASWLRRLLHAAEGAANLGVCVV